MSSFIKYLTAGCLYWIVAATVSADSPAPGFLEGHLKIVSPKEVELADATPSEGNESNYADYPLVVLSRDKQTEVAHVTADENGSYRISLPPGEGQHSGCPKPQNVGTFAQRRNRSQ